MTTKSIIFGLLLLGWSGGSGYWYMCKIKHYCDKTVQQTAANTTVQAVQTTDENIVNAKPGQGTTADSLEEAPVEEESPKITLSTKSAVYYFAFAQFTYRFTDAEKQYLAEVKNYLAANTEAALEINGYADTKGSPEANMRYSRMRAEHIVKLLVSEGINVQRIKMQYYGDANAVNTGGNADENARLSRRVELFVKP